MKATFLTALSMIELPDIGGKGEAIADRLYITTDNNFVLSKLRDHFPIHVGAIEYDHLKNTQAIIYSLEDEIKSIEHRTILKMVEIRVFLQCLWLVKDNSADTTMCYMANKNATHSNNWNVQLAMADGKYSIEKYGRSELREARAFASEVYDRLAEITSEDQDLLERTDRFDRAWYWVSAARAQPVAGERIALFCTALESLFGTSNSELAHQLSERVAVLLGKTGEERLSIYQMAKEAYGYRSQILHGSKIKAKKHRNVIRVVSELDELLRRCLIKALRDRELQKALGGSSENLNQFFHQKLFGN